MGHSPWGHKESDTTELLSTQAHMQLGFLLRTSHLGILCLLLCVCAKSLQSCLILCDPTNCSLPCPSPGTLPDPGIKPMALMSPALAGGFFTTSATWEACTKIPGSHKKTKHFQHKIYCLLEHFRQREPLLVW